MDGIEVCRRLREWSQVPIIMRSARSDENDKVKCLDPGADDDITKLFGAGEMMACINAVMRRTKSLTIPPIPHSFARGDLQINFVHR
jgi:two-component system KDP operon response regulator KdpE